MFGKLSAQLLKRTESILTKLGSNPDPIFTIIALCLFNMTLRPLITLSDKKQPKDRKLYAALREFVTECIAMPACVGISLLASKIIAPKMALPGNENAVKLVFSAAGLLVANFIIPIIGNMVIDPLMKKLKSIQNKDKPEKEQINNLNITSKSPEYPVLNNVNPYNLSNLNNIKPVNYQNIKPAQGLRIN